ncbi:hypothetical protein K353_01727 [Kitasatospora sp. SolWspMP-SS2h]|uniref:alpha/beta fold hydrolase n=1 Tax=Kitasatospora sp. SolWspMP-SS2h TaxID=1305729 RepID=UPI000DB90B3D|nr:hypothetical protein [Kitasatospora sp. SolWspMP-SS2h]RAJ44258.1 hypothetical protein K353_01727 [Kitasatospora sp. SolWspMP-SS2h]
MRRRSAGSGPLLLIARSGEGDADRTADLVPHLADTCTVLTYDRRGPSRSRLDHPERGASPAEHADAVRAATTRIVPAVGRTTPSAVFDRRCAQALGALLDTPVELLPGGHNGNTSHPRAQAARIKQPLPQAS